MFLVPLSKIVFVPISWGWKGTSLLCMFHSYVFIKLNIYEVWISITFRIWFEISVFNFIVMLGLVFLPHALLVWSVEYLFVVDFVQSRQSEFFPLLFILVIGVRLSVEWHGLIMLSKFVRVWALLYKSAFVQGWAIHNNHCLWKLSH